MTRTLKQIIYGGFYMAIVFAIFIYIYDSQLKPPPSCFDGKKNQEEAEIDCGGPNCTDCVLIRLRQLKAESSVKVFKSDDEHVVFLGDVVNPNTTYGAKSFTYSFLVYDLFDKVIETISGTSSIAPQGKNYLFAPIVATPFSKIERVELSFPNPRSMEWFKSGDAILPGSIRVTVASSTITNDTIRINGSLTNQGSVGATKVTVIALLFDGENKELFASQTIVPTLRGFGEENFVISFPRDRTLVENLVMEKTKYFVIAQ